MLPVSYTHLDVYKRQAEYTYNQQVSTVSTKYIYTVDKKSESTVDGTIMGIMPHQYKNIKTNISYMKNTARTLRGTVTVSYTHLDVYKRQAI